MSSFCHPFLHRSLLLAFLHRLAFLHGRDTVPHAYQGGMSRLMSKLTQRSDSEAALSTRGTQPEPDSPSNTEPADVAMRPGHGLVVWSLQVCFQCGHCGSNHVVFWMCVECVCGVGVVSFTNGKRRVPPPAWSTGGGRGLDRWCLPTLLRPGRRFSHCLFPCSVCCEPQGADTIRPSRNPSVCAYVHMCVCAYV